MSKLRKIIHVDMDSYYASIEQRDFPEYRGKPLVVGGPPDSRSVVATASYEARKYGVHSAMSCYKARQLCPHAIFVNPRFGVYKDTSREIHRIFAKYSDKIEPLSLDEAYIDVTDFTNGRSARDIAIAIKDEIKSTTRLTASAGVSYNKFLAKIASAFRKPDGLTIIVPEKAEAFLENLPIGKFHGVGKVTESKLLSMGIQTGKDLKALEERDMILHFGKMGSILYQNVRGIDEREVSSDWERKTVSTETTFEKDITGWEGIEEELKSISQDLYQRLLKLSLSGKTITIKIKYKDFSQHTRSLTIKRFFQTALDIQNYAIFLASENWERNRPVRLLGIGISSLSSLENIQDEPLLPFFSNQGNSP